jgi:hypothetical protein
MLVPPATDAGLVLNLKMSFSDTHMQLNHGGWSREITVRWCSVECIRFESYRWMTLTPRKIGRNFTEHTFVV